MAQGWRTGWSSEVPRPLGGALVVLLEAGCAVLDWRFSRTWPVSHLYYLPIALAGALFGFPIALPLALLSAGVFLTINFGHLTQAGTEADVVRLVLFIAVGLVASVLRYDAHELAGVAASLEATNAKLDQANEALRREKQIRVDYVARAAHDLAQPVTAMKAGADMLLRLGIVDAESSARELRAISGNGRRAGNMLENLIEAARMEKDGIPLHMAERVDVPALVMEAAETFGSAERREIAIDVGGQIPCIRGDARQLLRVFLNIVGNAVKYSPAGSPVRVTITAGQLTVEVAVRDEGVGIAASELADVLRPFVRSTGAGRTEGFGLGLAISHEIVAGHGGRLDIDSRVGAGTTVRVLLPIGGP